MKVSRRQFLLSSAALAAAPAIVRAESLMPLQARQIVPTATGWKVLGMTVVAGDGPANIRLEDEWGNPLTGLMQLSPNAGVVLPYQVNGWADAAAVLPRYQGDCRGHIMLQDHSGNIKIVQI